MTLAQNTLVFSPDGPAKMTVCVLRPSVEQTAGDYSGLLSKMLWCRGWLQSMVEWAIGQAVGILEHWMSQTPHQQSPGKKCNTRHGDGNSCSPAILHGHDSPSHCGFKVGVRLRSWNVLCCCGVTGY